MLQLGIDKSNPQPTHFWQKNGLAALHTVVQDTGMVAVAERIL